MDMYQNFAGLRLQHVEDGTVDTLLTPAELTSETNDMTFVKNDADLMQANDNTRLIGFRTTKRCHSSKQIKSIQPIYYSINEDICKNVLLPLTEVILDEIPVYGVECGDGILASKLTQ